MSCRDLPMGPLLSFVVFGIPMMRGVLCCSIRKLGLISFSIVVRLMRGNFSKRYFPLLVIFVINTIRKKGISLIINAVKNVRSIGCALCVELIPWASQNYMSS